MKIIIHIVPAAVLALLAALLMHGCGGQEGFAIDCEIKGLDNHGLVMTWLTRQGVQRAEFHPKGDKVVLRGTSPEPTLAEVAAMDGQVLLSCLVADGDRLKVKMTMGDPASLTVSGQGATRDCAAWTVANDSLLRHGSDGEVNAAIAAYVRANRASAASTLLLCTQLRTPGYEMLADSLLGIIDPQARPALLAGWYATALGSQVSTTARGRVQSFALPHVADSAAVRWFPGQQSYTMLVFNGSRKAPEAVKRLRALRKDYAPRRLALTEISLAPDSASWRASIARDTATWLQGWVPSGPAAAPLRKLALPAVPYCLVIDSTGAQVYRGAVLAQADSLVRSLLGAAAASAESGSGSGTAARMAAKGAERDPGIVPGAKRAPRRDQHKARRPGQ